MAIATLILGIIGLVLSCVVIGIIPAIIAVILGIVFLSKNGKDGKAIAGLVCGSLGILVFIIMLLATPSKTDSRDSDKQISSVTQQDVVITKEITGVNEREDKQEDIIKEKGSKDISISEDALSSAISIDEMVLIDSAEVKITTTGIEDTWAGTKLKLLIENNSGKDLTVQARDASVNGYMVDTMMSCDVASGKKANDGVTFTTSGLKECGITTIADMEFSFHIFDSDDWSTYYNTDLVQVKTKAFDGYNYVYDESGTVIYDSNGIKVVAKELSKTGSFWGPGLILYIYNGSNEPITVQSRDTSVNGFMVDTILSQEVTIGRHALTSLQFLSTNLEENNISDITEVETSLHIFNTDTWDTIVDTPPIMINFN